jgi:hypothetical protein
MERQDSEEQLREYVRPGERLLWIGRPDPDVLFTASDLFVVPFSLLWGGFAFFWEGSVIVTGAGPLFVLWGIPFVAIGLYMIVGRFFYKRRRKRRTAYALTDERALVAVGSTSLAESPVRNVPLNVRRSRDGRHLTVTFGSGGLSGRMYANTGLDAFGWWAPAPVAFFDVDDVEGLRAALDRARSRKVS